MLFQHEVDKARELFDKVNPSLVTQIEFAKSLRTELEIGMLDAKRVAEKFYLTYRVNQAKTVDDIKAILHDMITKDF